MGVRGYHQILEGLGFPANLQKLSVVSSGIRGGWVKEILAKAITVPDLHHVPPQPASHWDFRPPLT